MVVAEAPAVEAPAVKAADVEEAAEAFESKEEKEIRAAGKNQMTRTTHMAIKKAPRMYVRRRIMAKEKYSYRLKEKELVRRWKQLACVQHKVPPVLLECSRVSSDMPL